jgi:hypothetical protein
VAATSESEDELAYARELRIQLGLPSDEAALQAAASAQPDELTSTLGIPLTPDEAAEVDRRIRVQVGLSDAIDLAEASPGWAGAWIDQQSGGRVVFQFAGAEFGMDRALASSLPPEASFEIRSVQESMRSIEARRDAILGDVGVLRKLGINVTGVGTDVPGNRPSVTVDTMTDGTVETLQKRYGAAIQVKQGGVAAADACPETRCTPLKAGIGMLGKGGGWPCTVGYLARRDRWEP